MAWFPWVLAWGDEALRTPETRLWWRPALLAGGALGLQLLNGEPSTVVMSGLGLLALAASAAGRRLASLPRVLVPVAFAVALAAVQLLPTLGRLADSPRKDVPTDVATLWSMPPARLVEVVFPRFFGDPMRMPAACSWAGSSTTATIPTSSRFIRASCWPCWGWRPCCAGASPGGPPGLLCIAGGIFLALGRYNPLYEALREMIPVLAMLRFPEKFILLAVFALGFAGVLGWQRMLDEREAGRRDAVDLALALALVVLATALVLAVLFLRWSRAPPPGSSTPTALPIRPSRPARHALYYLFLESWVAVAAAAAVTFLLILCRWRRPPRRLLEMLALLLLAADLWYYGYGMLRTLPASVYRDPPRLLTALQPLRNRLFVRILTGRGPRRDRGTRVIRGLGRLSPTSPR